MAADNTTGDPQAPSSQLSLADIIIITVYFAANVAVGIWVRERGVGPGRRRHLPGDQAHWVLGWTCQRLWPTSFLSLGNRFSACKVRERRVSLRDGDGKLLGSSGLGAWMQRVLFPASVSSTSGGLPGPPSLSTRVPRVPVWSPAAGSESRGGKGTWAWASDF